MAISVKINTIKLHVIKPAAITSSYATDLVSTFSTLHHFIPIMLILIFYRVIYFIRLSWLMFGRSLCLRPMRAAFEGG
jgi:hypothetical protein